MPGCPHRQEAVEARPEHPEDDGAEQREQVTGVPAALPLPTVLSLDVPEMMANVLSVKEIYSS